MSRLVNKRPHTNKTILNKEAIDNIRKDYYEQCMTVNEVSNKYRISGKRCTKILNNNGDIGERTMSQMCNESTAEYPNENDVNCQGNVNLVIIDNLLEDKIRTKLGENRLAIMQELSEMLPHIIKEVMNDAGMLSR